MDLDVKTNEMSVKLTFFFFFLELYLSWVLQFSQWPFFIATQQHEVELIHCLICRLGMLMLYDKSTS